MSKCSIKIVHCDIDTGDDDIAIKTGAGPAAHMTIAHSHFYAGHGMSIGSGTSGGVSDIQVSDLSIDGADNGIPILGLDRRVTYVIGEDGHILKVYPSVDPASHAKQIVRDLGADKPPPTPVATPSPAPTATPATGPKQRKGVDSDSDSEPD